MKRPTLVLLLACLYSIANAQTRADTAVTQIRQLLAPGKHLIHYARPDPKPLTPEQNALLAKIQKALSENMSSIMDPDSGSKKTVSGNKEDILDGIRQKLGLTKEEWKTYQEITDPAKRGVAIYGEDTLEITSQGKLITFRGTGRAAAMDSLRVDLALNKVFFGQQQLAFRGIAHVKGADNGFHTPAVTYGYELNNHSMSDSADINTLKMETSDFGVTRFPLTGKTMIVLFTAIVQGSAHMQPQPGITLVFLME